VTAVSSQKRGVSALADARRLACQMPRASFFMDVLAIHLRSPR